MKTLIQARDLTIGHKDKILCKGIRFEIREGDCIMLCGANGSGKTTLLKAIEQMSGDIVMIPTGIPKVQGFTLREFVQITCFSRSDMGGRLSPEDESTIDGALAALDITGLASRDISTLSDGEFQKAGIAAALARRASVILLDEPTAFLDAENRINVLRTLRSLCDGTLKTAAGRPAVVFSTHDLHDGLSAATRIFAIGADGMFRCADSQDGDDIVKSIFLKPF